MFRRCDFEMNEALQLKKDVKLCPFVYDGNVKRGELNEDVCIAKIKTPVDSKKAFCSDESDKKDIHKVILSRSKNGFEIINTSVKRI